MIVGEVLLQEFRAGSESALDRIMNLYLKPLTFFATKIIGVESVAEEIVANSFIILHQRRGNFHSLSAIKSFLYLSTRNACINYLKSKARKYSLKQNPLADAEHAIHDDGDLLSRMIYAELVQILYQEIEKLPEQQGTIFRLSYLNGLNTKEISQMLNISRNAVTLGRLRAKNKLKGIFRLKKLLSILTVLFFFCVRVTSLG